MKSSKLYFFADCKSLEEIKSLYKNLAKIHHPDMGGSLEIMQQLNNEYSIAIKLTAFGTMSNEEFEKTILDSEAYKNALQKVIMLEGLIIECVGNWLWVTGPATYEHRAALKEATFMFAGKKKAWYFRTEDYKVTNRNQNYSLTDIKNKYGSTVLNAGNYQKNLLK